MLRILASALILSAIATPAYAYIDMAIGSMILQSLIASFFALLVMWHGFVAKTKNFFRGNGFRLDDDDDEDEETSPTASND